MPWINEIKNRFSVGGGYSKIFKFVTAIYGIAVREADVSDGGLPEVNRLGFVVVDCLTEDQGFKPMKRTFDVVN